MLCSMLSRTLFRNNGLTMSYFVQCVPFSVLQNEVKKTISFTDSYLYSLVAEYLFLGWKVRHQNLFESASIMSFYS